MITDYYLQWRHVRIVYTMHGERTCKFWKTGTFSELENAAFFFVTLKKGQNGFKKIFKIYVLMSPLPTLSYVLNLWEICHLGRENRNLFFAFLANLFPFQLENTNMSQETNKSFSSSCTIIDLWGGVE